MILGDVVAAIRAGSNDVDARPLSGGLNHRVFAVTLPDGTLACCKLFSENHRQADEREWRALCLLRDTGIELAPAPIYFEAGAVLMSFVEGEGLGNRSLEPPQVRALATQLDHLYRIRIPASAQLVGTPIATLVQRLRKLRGAATGDDPGLAVARRWLASREPDELARLDLAVFGRGDPNLANRLWHSPNLAFVDWEYSGRTSRVVELADLVEHLQSRETSDATWSTFLEHFDLTLDEEADLLRMRRLMSIYWLLLLQPGHPAAERNSEGSRRAQSERVLALLEGSR